jgi:predicted membrane protein
MQKPEEVEIRKAPKILPWALTGAMIGVLTAFALYALIPVANRSSEDLLGLLLVALGSLGLGLGVAVAIFVDMVSARRTKLVSAVRAETDDSQQG